MPGRGGMTQKMRRILSLFIALSMMLLCGGVLAQGAAAGGGAASLRGPADPGEPTPVPTQAPTPVPTEAPTPAPTAPPTEAPPSDEPTPVPTTPPVVHLQITTPSDLPPAKAYMLYMERIEANYADAVFAEAGGDFAAAGVRLSPGGVISGTPVTPGKYSLRVSATSAQAGETVEKSFTLVVVESGTTPTPVPTPQPTPTPSGAPSVPTPQPTPRPSNPSVTPTPGSTPEPSDQPTPTPYTPSVANPYWSGASSTIIKAKPDEQFEIVLVEGMTDAAAYSGLSGELPEGVELVNDSETNRSISIRGSVPEGASSVFGIEFDIGGGRKLTLDFVLKGVREIPEETVVPDDGFPQARPMIPFGGSGAKTAMLPAAGKKKEEGAEI